MTINNNEIPIPEIIYQGKTFQEYELYSGDTDFYLKIKKIENQYFVIYENAYGEMNGELMTKEEIKKTYNLILE